MVAIMFGNSKVQQDAAEVHGSIDAKIHSTNREEYGQDFYPIFVEISGHKIRILVVLGVETRN